MIINTHTSNAWRYVLRGQRGAGRGEEDAKHGGVTWEEGGGGVSGTGGRFDTK